MMPFIGVRISWETEAKNRLFDSVASCAPASASSVSRTASRRSRYARHSRELVDRMNPPNISTMTGMTVGPRPCQARVAVSTTSGTSSSIENGMR